MADNNIIIKITSEADLSQAQKQLSDYASKAYDLEKEMGALKKAEAEQIASLKKQAKDWEGNTKVLQKFEEQISDVVAKYKPLVMAKKDEIEANKKSIKTLNDSVKAYKTLSGQGGRMVQQLRAMREQLQQMEDAGEFGTQAFIDLSIAAGKLEDQIGDTQQRIRILASDTKELDAIMGLGDGLAGSFYIATSAAEVFGEDMEGLQKAFYKVQSAMSILSGVQQLYNTLQKDSALSVVFTTAVEKLAAKSKDQNTAALSRNTKAWITNGAASSGATIKTIAQTVATKAATIAQAALNAVIYANPFVLLGAAIAVAVAAIVGFVAWNSKGAKAAREFNKANEDLEKTQAKLAIGQEKRNSEHQSQLTAINRAENEAIAQAKARGASEIEMAGLRSKYAKKRAEETKKYNDDEIKRVTKQELLAERAMEAKRREVAEYKEGSKKQKKALEELAEAEQKYYGFVNQRTELANETREAEQAVTDAQREAAEARRQMALEAEQANIDLMKDGATKEIAQIQLSYKEKLRNLKGNSAEEVALRKALETKQAKEIADVRKKYAQQAQQVAIQEQKNLLTALAQNTLGTEEDYQEQVALTKKIAQDEAQARIDALDKSKMDEKDYAAQVEAIRLELANTLRDIDEQEVQRATENAKRRTDIAIMAAEAETKALRGDEPAEEQKAVWARYYAEREAQIKENAQAEIEAVNRSTDTAEVKAEKIKAIEKKMDADIVDIHKEGTQKLIEVDDQYLTELQIAVDKAQDKVSKAQTSGDKLAALKEAHEAELALYDEQMNSIKAKYEAGLITYQDYKQQEWEIMKATTDAETNYQMEALQAISEGFQTALGYIQQASDLVFEAIQQNIQAEMDALDKEYTTDWEEAQKNADKKYITEKEYEKKKADLEMKQAKYQKAQALINAGINTATAIVTTLAQLGATPWGIAAAAIAGVMGAVQIGIIASKPLAQYAKGRKGGEGEYALVGEKGPEIMYIPKGASIVPNDKIANQDAWAKYGVPRLPIPEKPSTNSDVLKYAAEQQIVRLNVNYEKMGAAFAAAMPKQQGVVVNVDRNGIQVNNGRDRRTYLNTKYTGTWN